MSTISHCWRSLFIGYISGESKSEISMDLTITMICQKVYRLINVLPTNQPAIFHATRIHTLVSTTYSQNSKSHEKISCQIKVMIMHRLSISHNIRTYSNNKCDGQKTNKYDGHALPLNETRYDINMAMNRPNTLYKKCNWVRYFYARYSILRYTVCMFLRSNKSTSQRARLFKA